MIPALEYEDIAQDFRHIVLSYIAQDNSMPVLVDEDTIIINSDYIGELDMDGLVGNRYLVMFSEWFNDMESIQVRVVQHDEDYDNALFCMLRPVGKQYVLDFCLVDIIDVISVQGNMLLQDFVSLSNRPVVSVPFSPDFSVEEWRTARGLMREMMS